MTSGQMTAAVRSAAPGRAPVRAPARQLARQERIVAVAMRHFAERGYEGVRIEEIALEAGVAKGAVFGYFTSKAGLFLAAYQAAARSVQQLPGGAAGGPRAGLLRGRRVLAPAHAAPDPRGLGPVPGDAARQLLLQPAAAARDHPVPAARGPVRHPGVRAVRHRARRDPPRHRRQDGRVPGGLADGPLPGRDRDRGAGPRAVRRGRRVTADAGRAGPAVRGAAAQRYRGRFRVRCGAAE